MAQELCHRGDVGTTVERAACEAVSEAVRVVAASYAGTSGDTFEHLVHAILAQRPTVRAVEHARAAVVWAHGEIVLQR